MRQVTYVPRRTRSGGPLLLKETRDDYDHVGTLLYYWSICASHEAVRCREHPLGPYERAPALRPLRADVKQTDLTGRGCFFLLENTVYGITSSYLPGVLVDSCLVAAHDAGGNLRAPTSWNDIIWVQDVPVKTDSFVLTLICLILRVLLKPLQRGNDIVWWTPCTYCSMYLKRGIVLTACQTCVSSFSSSSSSSSSFFHQLCRPSSSIFLIPSGGDAPGFAPEPAALPPFSPGPEVELDPAAAAAVLRAQDQVRPVHPAESEAAFSTVY